MTLLAAIGIAAAAALLGGSVGALLVLGLTRPQPAARPTPRAERRRPHPDTAVHLPVPRAPEPATRLDMLHHHAPRLRRPDADR